jgi:hypothetical protein
MGPFDNRPRDLVKRVAASFSEPRLRRHSLRALGEAPERSNLHRAPQIDRQISHQESSPHRHQGGSKEGHRQEGVSLVDGAHSPSVSEAARTVQRHYSASNLQRIPNAASDCPGSKAAGAVGQKDEGEGGAEALVQGCN